VGNDMTGTAVTLLDAGMGKTLGMKGVEIPHTIWSANALIVAPEVVVEVHRENIAAGADIITTNSYGIILSDLAKENLQSRYEELNRLAGELAQRAVEESGKPVKIAASLPPQNGSYRPDRVLDPAVLEPLYRKQAEQLAPYVDFFLCETMSTIAEGVAALSAVQDLGKPALVAFTLHDDDPNCLRSGEALEQAIEEVSRFEPYGILVNCCLPERISDAMKLLGARDVPVRGGYANAFTHVPRDWLLDGDKQNDGHLTMREDLTPQRYAEFALDWIEKGANLVGGCCGTTAEHIAAIRRSLD